MKFPADLDFFSRFSRVLSILGNSLQSRCESIDDRANSLQIDPRGDIAFASRFVTSFSKTFKRKNSQKFTVAFYPFLAQNIHSIIYYNSVIFLTIFKTNSLVSQKLFRII